jgi:Flp pilus assembly protein TadG
MMLRRLVEGSAGGVAIVTALVLPVLIGFTSLSVEIGHWYLVQREMQGAADAAAISAASEYIAAGLTGTSYQTEGQNYAALNGFTISTSSVCLITSSGNNCAQPTHPLPIVCGTPPCIVVDIAQTQLQMFAPLTEPTIKARAVVSLASVTTRIGGTGCVLTLANDASAILVHGNGNLEANCGVFVDGGRAQNVNGTPLGGIQFSGSNAVVHVSSVVVASNSTGCPSSHCFEFNPSTTPLPASAVHVNTATSAPAETFPSVPLGVRSATIQNAGSGYTNGTRTFTVVGGTNAFPAKFTATVSGGVVTGTPVIIDPGAYTVMPTNPVSVTVDAGGGSGAKFTLTEGCFTWPTGGTPLPGRKYCSINLNGAGTTNFAAGSYYIAGGDANCIGFCVSSANATVTSASAGVTFYLTNGEGNGTFGTSSYARISLGSGNVNLCAPGTSCGTTCTGTCLLFSQDPNAPASTAINTPANTVNSFSGNGTRNLSGLIYIPKQTVSLSGNGPISGCAGIVSKYLDVGGTPTFSNGCLPNGGFGGITTTTTTFRLSQ